MKIRYPKRLFLRALILQIVIFTLGYLVYEFFIPTSKIAPNNKISAFLFFALLSVVNLSIILAYILSPLMQIIYYLKKMVEDQVFNEIYWAQLSAYDNTPGEWQDLENVIKRLVRIIRKNFKALSREKIEVQALMNAVEDPIFAIDQNERVVFYNPAFGMVFGLEKGVVAEEIMAHQVVADANLLQLLRSSLKKGVADEQSISIHIRGQVYVFNVSVAPLKRETDDSIYGVVAVFRDRTQQIEINKKRLDFVANASHELRTPITMISSSVSVLKRSINNTANTKVTEEVLNTLEENSKRLVDLTESMLDLSSLESGEILDMEIVNCKEFTEEAIRINLFEKKTIEIDCPSDLYVLVDKKRLLQVITNLVTNAVRYSPKDKTILLQWSKGKTDKEIVLKIRDNGPGIPLDLQKRIFERFYRIDQSRSRKLGGIGIGLSIVNHIMKLHRGEVYVNSDYKSGAEFVCVFPNIDVNKDIKTDSFKEI